MPLELVIRNVSDKSLFVEHGLYPPHTPPTVIGIDGDRLSVSEVRLLGTTRLYQNVLKPGEAAVYSHLGLGLGKNPQPEGFWHPFLHDAATGKYRLSQHVQVSVREEGQDAGGVTLSTATGEVEFEIEPLGSIHGARHTPVFRESTISSLAALCEFLDLRFTGRHAQCGRKKKETQSRQVATAQGAIPFCDRVASSRPGGFAFPFWALSSPDSRSFVVFSRIDESRHLTHL